jgi:very-short-patch-repair endonuclease
MAPMRSLQTVVDLAGRQHGVVARTQATSLGASRSSLRRAVESHRIEWLSGKVLRVVGASRTDLQDAMACALDAANGVVALQSALALWEVPGWFLRPIHVLTTRAPHRGTPHLGVVHSAVRLTEGDVGLVEGVPVTTPARTLFDLSARLPPRVVEDLCDDLLRRGLMSCDALHEMAEDLPLRGGPQGRRLLRRLAAERPVGRRPTESKLETQFERILDRNGEPSFERQVDVSDGRGWIGRVDFADRAAAVVVEVQSALYHSSLTDRRKDADRIRRLRSAGWTVVEVTDDEIWRRPDRVLARVRAARAEMARRPA